MDAEKDDTGPLNPDALKALPRVHKPRKPRPSEIAAKKAKAAKKKPAKRTKKLTVTKPKAKKKPAKRPKVVKTKPATTIYSERLDMRMTRKAKAKIVAKAKKMRRTITSLVIEAIENFE